MDRAKIEHDIYQRYLNKLKSEDLAKRHTKIETTFFSTVFGFLTDTHDEDVIGRPTFEIYEAYKQWCVDHDVTEEVGKIGFSKKLTGWGFYIQSKKIGGKKYRILLKVHDKPASQKSSCTASKLHENWQSAR